MSYTSGPAWDWSALYGREEESKFLCRLVQSNDDNATEDDDDDERRKGDLSSDPNHAGEHLHPGATVLLHGPAGSGKSALVESQPWLDQYGWLLASGKFLANQDDFQQPFLVLIQALNTLIELWITHNDTVTICQLGGLQALLHQDVEFLLHVLPKAYQAVLEKTKTCPITGRPLHEVLPPKPPMEKVLSQIDEDQLHGTSTTNNPPPNSSSPSSSPPVPSISIPGDWNNTMDCINASFVRIPSFLCQARPVVLFLDDVQWADAASAKVLQVLATTQPVDNLILILSYRDNNHKENQPQTSEVSPCMQQTLAAIRQYKLEMDQEEHDRQRHQTSSRRRRKRHIYDLPLADLTVNSVNQLISSLTKRPLDQTMPLAQVVHQKTAGNAFFVRQFLQMLRREDFVR